MADRVEVLLCLLQSLDVFAWNPYEVPEVDPTFITHQLNVDPRVTSKKQKPSAATADQSGRCGHRTRRTNATGSRQKKPMPQRRIASEIGSALPAR